MEDEEDVLDIFLEEELIQDAGTDASIPSLFDDGLDESEVYGKQWLITKTSSLCTSTTAAAAPPSPSGNSSSSCILKKNDVLTMRRR